MAAKLMLMAFSPSAVDFDCSLRTLVYERSQSLLPPLSNLAAVFSALRLSECSTSVAPSAPAKSGLTCTAADPTKLQFHVSPAGSDLGGNGSASAPFLSLHRARDAVRTARAGSSSSNRPQQADVLLHEGTHRLVEPLLLTAEDSHTTYSAACPARGPVILSGAASLQLNFTRSGGGGGGGEQAWSAPTHRGLSNVEQLFLDGPGVGQRLVWARDPNGNAETDLQPVGCVSWQRAEAVWIGRCFAGCLAEAAIGSRLAGTPSPRTIPLASSRRLPARAHGRHCEPTHRCATPRRSRASASTMTLAARRAA